MVLPKRCLAGQENLVTQLTSDGRPCLLRQLGFHPLLRGTAMPGLGTVTYNIAKDWDLTQILERLESLKFEGVELRTTHKHGVEVNLSTDQRQRHPQTARGFTR